MALVVDSSVYLARMLDEPRAAEVQGLLLAHADEDVHAPSLLLLEVANVLELNRRKGTITATSRDTHLRSLQRLPIVLHDLPDDYALLNLCHLAAEHGLTTYDATYLQLSLRLAATLITFDKRLAQAGRRAGLRVLPA